MERPKFKWCRETIEQIRFKPDRDRVWNELMAHIEDRVEDMKSRGYTEEEAEVRAVTAMGDPVAVGKQLDAVHKPWLGWLWVASKVLVILCLLVLILTAVQYRWQTSYDGYSYVFPDRTAGILQEDGAELPNEITQIFYDEPGVSARLGDFTVTVDKITLNQSEHSYDKVLGLVTLEGFMPWEQPVEKRNFYIVDDKGNYYVPRYINGSQFVREQHSRWELSMTAVKRTATRWTYLISFNPLEGMEWFELRCDVAEHEMVLRVDMTGGDGA